MPQPTNTPRTITDFSQQAKDFVAKAKGAGKSNTAIANTINYMFTLFQMEREEAKQLKDTQWIDTDGDGIEDSLVDNQTGDIISSFGNANSDTDGIMSEIVNGGESAYDSVFEPVDQVGSTVNEGGYEGNYSNGSLESGSPQAPNSATINSEGGLDITSFANQWGGIPEQPMSPNQAAIEAISQAGKPKAPTHLNIATGEQVQDLPSSAFQGLKVDFSQPAPKSQLSIGGVVTPGINWKNLGL